MKSALVLIDLQDDYLATPGLEPAAGVIVAAAAALLADFRQRGLPVIHVRTTVTREPDNRMPHWKARGRWMCVAGTPGHASPDALNPAAGEVVIDKQFFSGFQDGAMERVLREAGCDGVHLAGVHMHACVRATALDAYARGFQVFIEEDAVGSDDAIHAAITRGYLVARGIAFVGSAATVAARQAVARTAETVHGQWVKRRSTTIHERRELLRRVAERMGACSEELAQRICGDVRKPIVMARGEVRRSIELLLRAAEQTGSDFAEASPGTLARRMPLGVVAVITPWNNPLAIPVGKIAPAWLFDNAVVWKPSPLAGGVARAFLEIWRACGGGGLQIVEGGTPVAAWLAADRHVGAVTLSGSRAAGLALQDIALRRHVPFQGELGGNNAAIVDEAFDIGRAAGLIAEGAFVFAGQRCTANRRVIVPREMLDVAVKSLTEAARRLAWGDPHHEATRIGPVIDARKARQLRQLRQRVEAGCHVIEPHAGQADRDALLRREDFVAPIIVVCDDPAHEIVQEESFGPVLVVQPADSFAHAMRLLNGVRQGLVAALFSNDAALQERFLREAQAGVLKINQATVDADAVSPFGGWKASGVGPPEHGIADREFFTRWQTIYHSEPRP